MIAKNLTKENKIIMLIAVAIPLAIFLYLIYANFLASHTFNYFYDIGEKNEKYLSPTNRISLQDSENTYRNMTAQLVYFNVPIVRGADSVLVEVRFKNVIPDNRKFSLGAKNQANWSYQWKDFSLDRNKGDWTTQELEFKLSELFPENGQLSFVFNAPHLNQEIASEQELKLEVPIDWIRISVNKGGILK